MIKLAPYCMLVAVQVQCRQELAVIYRNIDIITAVLAQECGLLRVNVLKYGGLWSSRCFTHMGAHIYCICCSKLRF